MGISRFRLRIYELDLMWDGVENRQYAIADPTEPAPRIATLALLKVSAAADGGSMIVTVTTALMSHKAW